MISTCSLHCENHDGSVDRFVFITRTLSTKLWDIYDWLVLLLVGKCIGYSHIIVRLPIQSSHLKAKEPDD